MSRVPKARLRLGKREYAQGIDYSIQIATDHVCIHTITYSILFTCLLHTYSEIPGNDTAMTTSCKAACTILQNVLLHFTQKMLWQEGAFLEALHIKTVAI